MLYSNLRNVRMLTLGPNLMFVFKSIFYSNLFPDLVLYVAWKLLFSNRNKDDRDCPSDLLTQHNAAEI